MIVSMKVFYESSYPMIHHVGKLQIQFLEDIFHRFPNSDQKVFIGLISKSKYIATSSIDMVME